MIRDLSTTPSQSTRKCSSLHTPCLCVTLSDTFPPTSSPVSHLPYLLPSSVSRNSFVCHSYENCRGVYQQFPFWFTPSEARSLRSACFRGRQKLITFSPTFRTSKRQNFQTFNVFGPILFPFKFLLTLLRFFALFCTHQEPNPFIFKLFRTLCPKPPRVGYPRNLRQGSGISPTKQKQTRAVLHDRFSTSGVLSVVSSRPWPCSSAHPATSARPANPNQEGCTRD